jgi:hypothetical protein
MSSRRVMLRDRCPGARSCSRGRRGAQQHLSNLLHVVQVEGYAGVGGAPAVCQYTVQLSHTVHLGSEAPCLPAESDAGCWLGWPAARPAGRPERTYCTATMR